MATFTPFDDLIAALAAALRRPLPGASAHALLEPRPRRARRPARGGPLRDAAALVVLFPLDGRAHLALTLRQAALGRHAGQISFPGGVVDPGESIEQAALREAREEIGLGAIGTETLGRLTPVDIVVSGFRLHPVVARTERQAFVPARHEVAAILEPALDELGDPRRLVLTYRRRGRQQVAAPAFRTAGQEVWGATAMVLAELLVLTGWTGQRPT